MVGEEILKINQFFIKYSKIQILNHSNTYL